MRRSVRWTVCAAVGLGAVLAIALGPAVAGAAPQGPGVNGTEFLDVVPSDGLHDGQTVMVSGKGFPPNTGLAAVECLRIESTSADCDLSTAKLAGFATGADGSFPPSPFVVRAIIHVQNRPGPVPCDTNGCAISVGTVNETFGGEHCISFHGPCTPAPPPSPTSSSGITTPAPTTTSRASASGGGGSNGGLIAAVVAAVVVIGALIGYLLARRRSRA